MTGIKFGKFTLNEAFEVKDDSLFDTIMNLSRLIRHYKVQVDQVKFEGKNVTLYSGEVEVYLGQKDFYDDDLAALSSVLKKTNKKGLAGTINMENFVSGDRIILKTTGDSSGGSPKNTPAATQDTPQDTADPAEGSEDAAQSAAEPSQDISEDGTQTNEQ